MSFVLDSDLQFVSKVSPYTAGGPQMVECFATWCGPCRQMVPHLAALTKKYPTVNIVSVSQEDFGTVSSFSLANPATRQYNLAVDKDGKVQKLMDEFGVSGIPHAFLINSKGAVVWHGHPASCESELVKLAQEAPVVQPKPDSNTRTTVNWAALGMKK